MKKITACFFWLMPLILFIFSDKAEAQTSDEIKYDIAYDVSGSVPIFDRNNNLQQLLEKLIRVKANNDHGRNQVGSFASFNISFFGEKADTLTGVGRFDAYAHDPTRESAAILHTINDMISRSHSQKKTYLIRPLDNIIKRQQALFKANTNKISKGLFIFTDGILRDGDFDPGTYQDRESYTETVRDMIRKLENFYKIPVFIIQSSPNPIDPYLVSRKGDKLIANDSTQYLATGNFFWVREAVTLKDSIQNAKIFAAFYKFLDNANSSIALSNDNIVSGKDTISAVLGFESILLKLKDLYHTSKDSVSQRTAQLEAALTAFAGQGEGRETFVAEVRNLNTAISSPQLDSAAIHKIKMNLAAIAAHPNWFRQLIDQLNMQIANVPSLVSADQSLILADAGLPAQLTDLTSSVNQISNNASLQTQIWQGLGKFIIKRSSQELLFSFCENIDSVLIHKPKYALMVQALFPHIKQVLDNPGNYTDLSSVRNAFFKDFNDLPDNLTAHKELIHSEGLLTLLCYYKLSQSILYNGNLEAAFKELEKGLTSNNLPKVFLSVHQQLPDDMRLYDSKIRQAIIFSSKLIGYLTTHNLADIFNDDGSFKDAAKLLTALSIDPTNIVNLSQLDDAAILIRNLYSKYKGVKAEITSLQKTLKETPHNYQDYQIYIHQLEIRILQSAAELMLSGTDILPKLQFKDKTMDLSELQVIVARAKDCIDAYFKIKNGQYAEAGTLLMPDLINSLQYNFYSINHQILDSVALYWSGKIVNIAAQLSSAKSKDEAEEIIEENVLPVASYKIKRTNVNTVSLTAYPGVGGIGYINKSLTPGIFSPVGFEYSFPLGHRNSLSLFGSVVDIGNIVNYQLANSSDNNGDVINLNNIVSPGIFIVYGITNRAPFSILAGYEANPSRVVFGVALDLPLISFWKSGNK